MSRSMLRISGKLDSIISREDYEGEGFCINFLIIVAKSWIGGVNKFINLFVVGLFDEQVQE